MGSIADDLRCDVVRTVAHLSAAERIALALRLGDDDVARYRAAHAVSETAARAALARARGIGRVPSRSNEPADQ